MRARRFVRPSRRGPEDSGLGVCGSGGAHASRIAGRSC
jgi:hypothetical protein